MSLSAKFASLSGPAVAKNGGKKKLGGGIVLKKLVVQNQIIIIIIKIKINQQFKHKKVKDNHKFK